MIQNFASGHTVCANPVANIDIVCGFQPHHVIVWCDNSSNGLRVEWVDSMAPATGAVSAAATGNLSTASAGITPQSHGFRIGTGAQYAALDLYWIAE